jgi:hypothetical protein
VDENQNPLPNIHVYFFLEWAPLSGNDTSFEICNPRCENENKESCLERNTTCTWIPEGTGLDTGGSMGGSIGGSIGGSMGGSMGGNRGSEDTQGVCQINGEYNGDERCTDMNQCAANLCLPSELANSVPIVITPFKAQSDQEGLVSISVTTKSEPGIYSVRAQAMLNQQTQNARSPNFTVYHQIPSQSHISLSCSNRVISGFNRRTLPDQNNGTDLLGYIHYQRPGTECRLQIADRFSGRVPNQPAFFYVRSRQY